MTELRDAPSRSAISMQWMTLALLAAVFIGIVAGLRFVSHHFRGPLTPSFISAIFIVSAAYVVLVIRAVQTKFWLRLIVINTVCLSLLALLIYLLVALEVVT